MSLEKIILEMRIWIQRSNPAYLNMDKQTNKQTDIQTKIVI